MVSEKVMVAHLEMEMELNRIKIKCLSNYSMNREFELQARLLRDINEEIGKRIANGM